MVIVTSHTADTDRRTPRIECYCRVDDPAVVDRVTAICARLNRLASSGRIERYAVVPWPRRVVEPEGDERSGRVLERVRDFERLAARRGASLAPAFDRRTVDSTITGQRRDVVVLPILCLAASVGDDLVDVVPCSRDGYCLGVDEFLGSLERNGGSRVAQPAD